MSDCPYCGEWRYDGSAAPLMAKLVDRTWPPVVWDGQSLRQARGSDEPNGRHCAAGAHVCAEHWLEPEVIRLGPVIFEMGY